MTDMDDKAYRETLSDEIRQLVRKAKADAFREAADMVDASKNKQWEQGGKVPLPIQVAIETVGLAEAMRGYASKLETSTD